MSQAPPIPLPTEQDETAQAQALARRYRSEFVDLRNFRIRHEGAAERASGHDVPLQLCAAGAEEDRLVIAVSDPSKLMMLDEISGLLGQRIVTRVATLSQITDLLKKTEQSQRVLDEARRG